MKYIPEPIDLEDIDLGNLSLDIEFISRNIHETWAKQRELQGWSFGPVYDLTDKKHPCIIPYNDLPETEKDIDRATVIQTIKTLLWLGYKIERKDKDETENRTCR